MGYEVYEKDGIVKEFTTNIPNENEVEYEKEIRFSFGNSLLEDLIKRAFEAGKSEVVIPRGI